VFEALSIQRDIGRLFTPTRNVWLYSILPADLNCSSFPNEFAQFPSKKVRIRVLSSLVCTFW